jgi:hypothetical protein
MLGLFLSSTNKTSIQKTPFWPTKTIFLLGLFNSLGLGLDYFSLCTPLLFICNI